jgi:hypothetical protein
MAASDSFFEERDSDFMPTSERDGTKRDLVTSRSSGGAFGLQSACDSGIGLQPIIALPIRIRGSTFLAAWQVLVVRQEDGEW